MPTVAAFAAIHNIIVRCTASAAYVIGILHRVPSIASRE